MIYSRMVHVTVSDAYNEDICQLRNINQTIDVKFSKIRE